MAEWRVSERRAGQRLDQALEEALPSLGLRGRRRLISGGGVLLNGRPGKSAQRVRAGDLVTTADPPAQEPPPGAAFLESSGPYCFFYKPAGMHTARIAGGSAPSLESALPDLLPQALKEAPQRPALLQRLDWGTSGIVTAALSKDAGEAYRKMEKDGRVQKLYLALLQGRLEKPVAARRALDTDNRRKTRILPWEGAKATSLTPLFVWENGRDCPFTEAAPGEGPATLALCALSSGQRHQIRAHAAFLGHPLCGDSLYGGGLGAFILQHFALRFPGHEAALDGGRFIMDKLPQKARQALAAALERRQARS